MSGTPERSGEAVGPLPGTSYSLVKLLGSGGSGEVYLGIHEPLGKQVAIKLLRRDRDPESQDRLRAEARLLARISHPALVGVYDLGTTSDGRPFLVMEYVEGETLSERLRRQGAIADAVACELCAQILDGLAVAHAHGIVHRDIKGSNIIVGNDGKARIVDFGVAKAVVGRLPSLDLYATGCLLFELVSGAPPSPDASPVTLPHEANPELEAFVAQVLAKDPAERPSSAEAMAEELRRITRGAAPAGEPAPVRKGSSNVREPPTTFLGRATELVALASMFGQGDRIVTLTGPGGSGKTRLGKRYAAAHVSDYAQHGGTWFISLAEARSASDVLTAVARVMGVSLQGGKDDATAITQLGRALAALGPMLLVVDNCEQAAAEIARVVGGWLESVPEARFLATSRERLGVTGERIFDVLPLGATEAERLFVDRTRLVRPDYSLGDDDRVVPQLVQALDGLPLAIELAAARMALMSASTLLERLASRFDLLRATGRDAPAHQRTLYGTIDWSFSLLETWEQSALAQCSAFRAGFTLDAAEAIVSLAPGAPPVLEVIARLRDKSLVYGQPSRDFPSEIRLGLYESIRDYAALKLEGPDALATHERHTRYFLSRGVEWAERASRGSPEHLRRLALEADNLRSVHQRALDRSPNDALVAADILHVLLHRRAPLSAAVDLASRTLEKVGDRAEPALVATALYNRSNVWRLLGAGEKAREDAERLLEIARATGDPVCEAQARIRLAQSEGLFGGSPDARRAHAEAALAAALTTNDAQWQCRALTQLGSAQLNEGHRERARDTFLQIVALADDVDDAEGAAAARANLAVVLMELGELGEAERAFEEAIAALGTMGYTRAQNIHLYNLAALRQERGEYERAERAYRQVIASETDSGFVRALCFSALGALLAARGQLEEAASALDTAESVAGATYSPLVATHRGQLDLGLARQAAQHGDSALAAQHRASASRRLAEAESHAHLADDIRTARRWLERALLLDTSDGYPADAWIVAEDGAWFRPPRGWRVGIESRVKARHVLRALLRARLESPGHALSLDLVLEAGWPGEKMQRRAAEARVYNIIKMLRNAGMRDLLLSTGAGYSMDPDQVVVVAR